MYVKQYADEPMVTVPLSELENIEAQLMEIMTFMESMSSENGFLTRLVEQVGTYYGLEPAMPE